VAGLCISHGGGKRTGGKRKRCTHAGCEKASRVAGLCSAHGGGKRTGGKRKR
jgi:hypothetical protein